MTGVFVRRENIETQGRKPCEAEAETGVMWPQTKEFQELPEAGRGKERILPASLQKEPTLQTP